MKAIIQRVKYGSVIVENKIIAQIKQGLVIFLGVGPDDTEGNAQLLARKISQMRIFEDDNGKMNLSVIDKDGQAIVVSQFTLFANTKKGNRPSFIDAAPPEIASPLVDCFVGLLNDHGVPTQKGEFGAHMLVKIENDGPVTIALEL